MTFMREENLIPLVEEKRIEWTSINGKWQIIGQVRPEPQYENRPWITIDVYRYDSDHRKMMKFFIGGNGRKQMPGYVLRKYDEIHDEIRGRGENSGTSR